MTEKQKPSASNADLLITTMKPCSVLLDCREVSSHKRPHEDVPEPFRGIIAASTLPSSVSANRVEDDPNFSANMDTPPCSAYSILKTRLLSCEGINSKRRKNSESSGSKNSDNSTDTTVNRMKVKSVKQINESVNNSKVNFLPDLRILYKSNDSNNSVTKAKKPKNKIVKKNEEKRSNKRKSVKPKLNKLTQQKSLKINRHSWKFNHIAPINLNQIKVKLEPTEQEKSLNFQESLEPNQNLGTITPFETVFLPTKIISTLTPSETHCIPAKSLEDSCTLTPFESDYVPAKSQSKSLDSIESVTTKSQLESSTLTLFENVYVPIKNENVSSTLTPVESVTTKIQIESSTLTPFESVYLPSKSSYIKKCNSNISTLSNENIFENSVSLRKVKLEIDENNTDMETMSKDKNLNESGTESESDVSDLSDSEEREEILPGVDGETSNACDSDSNLPDTWKCPYCSTDFHTAEKLCAHLYLDNKMDIKNYKINLMHKSKSTKCKVLCPDKKIVKSKFLNRRSNTSCKICRKMFPNICSLRQHKVQSKHDYNIYKCFYCGDKFCDIAHISEHANIFHDGRRAFGCQECGSKFKNATGLIAHCATTVKPCKMEESSELFNTKVLYRRAKDVNNCTLKFNGGLIKIGSSIDSCRCAMFFCCECNNCFSNIHFLDQHFISNHMDKIADQTLNVNCIESISTSLTAKISIEDSSKHFRVLQEQDIDYLLKNKSQKNIEIQSGHGKQSMEDSNNKSVLEPTPNYTDDTNAKRSNMIDMSMKVNPLKTTEDSQCIKTPVIENIVNLCTIIMPAKSNTEINNQNSKSILKIIKNNSKIKNKSTSSKVINAKKIPIKIIPTEAATADVINSKCDSNNSMYALNTQICETESNNVSNHDAIVETANKGEREEGENQIASTKNEVENTKLNKAAAVSLLSFEEVSFNRYVTSRYIKNGYIKNRYIKNGYIKNGYIKNRYVKNKFKKESKKNIKYYSKYMKNKQNKPLEFYLKPYEIYESDKNTNATVQLYINDPKSISTETMLSSDKKIKVVLESPQTNTEILSDSFNQICEETKTESVIKIVKSKKTNMKQIPCKTKKIIGLKKIPLQLICETDTVTEDAKSSSAEGISDSNS